MLDPDLAPRRPLFLRDKNMGCVTRAVSSPKTGFLDAVRALFSRAANWRHLSEQNFCCRDLRAARLPQAAQVTGASCRNYRQSVNLTLLIDFLWPRTAGSGAG